MTLNQFLRQQHPISGVFSNDAAWKQAFDNWKQQLRSYWLSQGITVNW